MHMPARNLNPSRAGVSLRPPVATDAERFIALAQRSSKLHAPWTSAPSSLEAFAAYLAQAEAPGSRSFLVCRPDEAGGSDQIAGVFNLSQMVMGNFRSAYLGYYVFAGFERKGLMRSGLIQLVRHAFGPLKLHRMEANIQPANGASIALVRSCGFQQEGFSPRYLKINGRWRDHERWAIVAD
jgi:ribosomal-protein-alanine N-acetyltransferase